MTPFIIESKRVKYLVIVINLAKEVQVMHTKSYRTPLKEIKELSKPCDMGEER